jgi:hypothetical protein
MVVRILRLTGLSSTTSTAADQQQLTDAQVKERSTSNSPLSGLDPSPPSATISDRWTFMPGRASSFGPSVPTAVNGSLAPSLRSYLGVLSLLRDLDNL